MSQTWSQAKKTQYKKYAMRASVALSCALCAIKTLAAFATGSLAVISSLVDSLSDVVASLVSFCAVHVSSKPISCTHRYGYSKAEHLSALFQSAFIGGSGIFVFYGGINRFLNPIPLKHTGFGIWIMIISLAATFGLVMFQNYVAKNTQSMAVKADSGHYVSDFLSNGGVILSLFIGKWFDVYWPDTLIAFIIAVYLIFYAWKIGKEATDFLMDKELSTDIREQIIKIVLNVEGVLGMHDLRTRDLGGMYYFEFHVEFDGSLILSEAHAICEEIEKQLNKTYPDAQILIHQDPYGIKENRLDDFLNQCPF